MKDRFEYVDNRFLALGDFTEASVLIGGRTARLSIEGVSGETAGEAILDESKDLCSEKPSQQRYLTVQASRRDIGDVHRPRSQSPNLALRLVHCPQYPTCDL